MGLGVSGKDKPAYAKSKIYLGFVFEEAGQFSLAAESFQVLTPCSAFDPPTSL